MKYNYSLAASDFIFNAFTLLDKYKTDPNSSYIGSTSGLRLHGPFILQITDTGAFRLCKICTLENGSEYVTKVIGHSYNRQYSKITYIGKLLAVYLEHLQLLEDE